MGDLIKKSLLLGIGAISMTKEKVEQLVDELVKKGEVSGSEAKKLVDELMERGAKHKDELQVSVREEMERWRGNLGLVTKRDLEALEQRIEERLRQIEDKLKG